MMIKTLNIKYCLAILCFFVPVNPALSQDKDESQSPTGAQIEMLKSEIMYAEIKSISDPNTSIEKQQMSDLMKYIQVLEIPKIKQKSDKKSTAELIESIEPVTLKKEEVKAIKKDIDTSLEPGEVINLTLKDRPDKIVNSFALAEVLYLKNDYTNAVRFYEVSLKETIKSKEPEKRAWILFQIANCYKLDNPQKAVAYFNQVVAEFPEYQLSPIALLQKNIIQWQLDNKPQLTLEKYISDPNSL